MQKLKSWLIWRVRYEGFHMQYNQRGGKEIGLGDKKAILRARDEDKEDSDGEEILIH